MLSVDSLSSAGREGLCAAKVVMTDFDTALRNSFLRLLWRFSNGDPLYAYKFVESKLVELQDTLDKLGLLGMDLHDGRAVPPLPIPGLDAPAGASERNALYPVR